MDQATAEEFLRESVKPSLLREAESSKVLIVNLATTPMGAGDVVYAVGTVRGHIAVALPGDHAEELAFFGGRVPCTRVIDWLVLEGWRHAGVAQTFAVFERIATGIGTTTGS
ncbi:MAG: hypothetical protein U1F43_30235 [Myxococcota bacterium]